MRRLLRDTAGASAAEFTLILPILILLTLGVINVGIMLHAYVGLHYAAEDAARCRAVKTTVCTDNATTATYALTRYTGISSAPTFTRTTAGCGNTVQGSLTYNFNTGLTSTPVNMRVSACYPLQS